MNIDYEVIIVGAGVIGLAVAKALADREVTSVLVIDKEASFGYGISSRNSEVIHSGIYYPSNDKKAEYCIRGRDMLYRFCCQYNVGYSKCGKLVVAQSGQESELERLYRQAEENLVPEIYMMNKKEIRSLEPQVTAELALFVGCTGILSAHELMSAFYRISEDSDHDYLFKASLIEVEPQREYYNLTIHGPGEVTNDVSTRWVVNAGGLNSDLIANLLWGTDKKDAPSIHYSRGSYFKLSSRWRHRIQHLIYPIPDREHDALGIHLSIDMAGDLRLGPDAEFLEHRKEDYFIDSSLRHTFYREGKKYLPNLRIDDISPDFVGIRPKLLCSGKSYTDFYVKHEIDSGYPGWVNLIGIDSPGLTSAIAIGEDVATWISDG